MFRPNGVKKLEELVEVQTIPSDAKAIQEAIDILAELARAIRRLLNQIDSSERFTSGTETQLRRAYELYASWGH